MTRKEYDSLIVVVDKMIETSEPTRGEYFRGYRRGIRFHVFGELEETEGDHNFFQNATDGGSGDAYLDAFARGYRDGCKGRKPEESRSFPSRD